MPSPMLLEHVFGSWSMMSFPMPWKRRLAVPSGCRMSSSRPSMMTSWSVRAMQRRPIRMTGSADRLLQRNVDAHRGSSPSFSALGVLSGRVVAFVVHVVEQRLELGRGEERADGVLGHAPPWLLALHGHLVPWAWMAAAVAIPAQVDGLGHLVLRLQTDRNGLLVCHDGSFQYVSGGSGAVRSAMM